MMRDTEAGRGWAGKPGPLGAGHMQHLKESGGSLLAPWGKGVPSRGTDGRRSSRSEVQDGRVGPIHDVVSQDKRVTGLGASFLCSLLSPAKLSSSMAFIPPVLQRRGVKSTKDLLNGGKEKGLPPTLTKVHECVYVFLRTRVKRTGRRISCPRSKEKSRERMEEKKSTISILHLCHQLFISQLTPRQSPVPTQLVQGGVKPDR